MSVSWKRCVAAWALVAIGGSALAQPVYKWVDAEGKTHYGAQPPPAQEDAQALKLQSNNGTSGRPSSSAGSKPGAAAGKSSGSAAAQQQFNPDGTKKISKDVEELGQGFKKALETVDGKKVALNCAAAVDNIHYQADQMLEVGQKNVRDGYLSQANYDSSAPKIRENKAKYSLADCQSASGNKHGFYQCMSSSRNHVMACDKQFKH
jgi:hypothetical protein